MGMDFTKFIWKFGTGEIEERNSTLNGYTYT